MASPSPVFDIIEHIIPGQHIREYARATATSQEEKLVLHVKQYIPKGNGAPQKGDLSILGSHANGFPKELYEPLWEDLVKELSSKGVRVGSIWIADCAWQGQSGILNRDVLGNDPSWFDYTRDMLQMVNHFRMPRPLVGIGHSFGACALTKLALFHPRLFSALALIDPVIAPQHPDLHRETFLGPPLMSARRRDVWPSRDAAAASFRRSPFYQTWDPRVFDRWVTYGLTECRPRPSSSSSDGPAAGEEQQQQQQQREVTLTTTKHQEVFTFFRPSHHAVDADGKSVTDMDLVPDMDLTHGAHAPVYRPEPAAVFDELPHLRPPVTWVFGGASYMSAAAQRAEKMAATGVGRGGSGGAARGRCREVVGEGWGHLIPLEAPGFVARAAAACAADAVRRWRDGEQRGYEAWARKPRAEKTRISPETLAEMGRVVKPKM